MLSLDKWARQNVMMLPYAQDKGAKDYIGSYGEPGEVVYVTSPYSPVALSVIISRHQGSCFRARGYEIVLMQGQDS